MVRRASIRTDLQIVDALAELEDQASCLMTENAVALDDKGAYPALFPEVNIGAVAR